MDDRLPRVESALHLLERRVAVLEHALAVSATHAVAETHPGELAEPLQPASGSRFDVAGVLALVGRVFVVLGGAYLLRALTDSAILPQAAGIALGLAYALTWFGFAERTASTGRALSATFHLATGSMIAYPLLWEAASRFGVIAPEIASAALALVAALGLVLSYRWQIQTMAWITELGATMAALALVASTGVVVPFALFAISFGIATLWLGYTRDWIWLRWPAALVADLLVVALTLRVASQSWGESSVTAIAVQLTLLNGYVASIAVRTLVRARNVLPFEIVQTIAVVAVGFGGAVFVAHQTGAGVTALALLNLAAGAACYGIAFAFVARRQGVGTNFYFYTSLGLVLVVVSSGLTTDARWLAPAWSALAVATAVVARKLNRAALNLHTTVYLIAAAQACQLLSTAAAALTGQPSVGGITRSMLLVLVAAAGCAALTRAGATRRTPVDAVARLLILALLVFWTSGAIVTFAFSRGIVTTDGAVATMRTVVFAAIAVAVAALSRTPRFLEAGWLLYPLLVLTGAKVLVDDLPHSRPSTLFIALAAYGVALIFAPRLARR